MVSWPASKVYAGLRRKDKARSDSSRRYRFAWFRNWQRDISHAFLKYRRQFSLRYLFYALGVIFVVSVSYLVFCSPLLTLKTVVVTLAPNPDELAEEALKQEIIKRVGKTNLLFLRPEKDLAFLFAEPTFASVVVQKDWGRGLRVIIQKRVARAVVVDPQGELLLADQNGVLFAWGSTPGLAIIEIPRGGVLGDRIEVSSLDFVLRFLEEISALGKSCERVVIDETLISLKILDGPEIQSSPAPERVGPLIEILKNYAARGISLKRVDWRYQDPVVEY